MTNLSYNDLKIANIVNQQNDELFDEKKICWQHIKILLKSLTLGV